jgi:hypothetical protein
MILAIPTAADTIPKKPKIPATIAMIKNNTAMPTIINTCFSLELCVLFFLIQLYPLSLTLKQAKLIFISAAPWSASSF